jgi:REP element-mobilizing transposase RayT
MTRPLRVDQPGLWHHVTHRGNARQAIFLGDGDRAHYLGLLAELGERYELRVHAYVLMPNHYHLLVETPVGNLSRAIQWLSISYCVWFNRRHQRVGHLFQGRFRSIVVEGGAWAAQLSEYVHLNPVRTAELGWGKAQRQAERTGVGAAPSPAMVAERLKRLRTYQWSSYRAYAGYARPPEWLVLETILGAAGSDSAGRQAAYRRRVEGAVQQSVPPTVWERLQAGLALGSAEFADRVRRWLKPEREKPAKRPLRARASLSDIVAWVEREKGEPRAAFWRRRGDWGRPLALWAGRRYGGMTLRELGQAAGMDYGAVTMLVRRFVARAGRDQELAARQGRLVQEMFNVKI